MVVPTQVMEHVTDAVRVGISPADMYQPAASIYIVVYVLIMYCLLMHGMLAAVLEEYMLIKEANGGHGFLSPAQVTTACKHICSPRISHVPCACTWQSQCPSALSTAHE